MPEREQPYETPEAAEVREAYLALKQAQARYDAAMRTLRDAGWTHVGVNRWDPPR